MEPPKIPQFLQSSELTQVTRKLQSLTNIIRSSSQFQTITSSIGSISNDLTKLKMDMIYFNGRFNNTLDFFSKINIQLDNIITIYEDYQLYYIVLIAVVILVVIKLFSLLHSVLTICGEYKQLVLDFKEFRKTQRKKDYTYKDQIETQDKAYPLVRYRTQQD